jgi:hypothetical protein
MLGDLSAAMHYEGIPYTREGGAVYPLAGRGQVTLYEGMPVIWEGVILS